MKIVIKENEGFRLTLKKEACDSPEGLYNVEMLQEQLKDGEVITTSTYQFFMTEDEMDLLAKGLTQ